MPEKGIKVNNLLPKKPTYWVHYVLWGNGTEWQDAGLPTPNYFYRFENADGILGDRYAIGYIFDGIFMSKKASAYLEDILRRFIITLPIKERLMYRPDGFQHGIIYKLKQFQNLESIAGGGHIVPKFPNLSARHNSGRFWETKLWIEYEIKRNGGEGSPVSFDTMFDIIYEAWKWKDLSTCRGFARNIWRWYESRDWQYHILNYRKSNKSEEEIYMTRKERAISNSKKRAEEAKRKIINATTGLFSHEYKTGTGKWNISKIAKELSMSRDTVRKYIKEIEVEKALKQEVKIEEMEDALNIFD